MQLQEAQQTNISTAVSCITVLYAVFCVFYSQCPADGRHTIPDDGLQSWSESGSDKEHHGARRLDILKPVGPAVWNWICVVYYGYSTN